MKEIKISNSGENGFYSIIEVGDFEYVNPIEKMAEIIIDSSIVMDRNSLLIAMKDDFPSTSGIANPGRIVEKVLRQRALQMWECEYKKAMAQTLPENIFDILENTSKKEQINILKNLSFTGEQLLAFIFKAYVNYGFTYSTYSSTHNHTGLDEIDMPIFAYKEDDGNITSVGKTNLTDGQIKQAITDRRVTIAKFLDKGKIWHCFFLTFKSITGQERGWEGRPHLHYISNNWGLSRKEVLLQLRAKNYKLPSPLPHINWDPRLK